MIKTKEEMRHASVTGLRGGIGELYQEHILEKEETAGRTDLFCVFTIEPGRTIGLHTHDTNAEVYYVMEGEIEVNQNGELHTVRVGDVVFTADGQSHSVANNTNQTAKMLAVIFPQ